MPLPQELLAAHASIAANAGPEAALSFYQATAHPITPLAYWYGIWNEAHEGFGAPFAGQELKAFTAAEKIAELWWARVKRTGDIRDDLHHRSWCRAVDQLWPKVARLPTWRIGDRWSPQADEPPQADKG